MFKRFLNWFLSLFDSREERQSLRDAQFDESPPQHWRIQFRHRGCESLIATYSGPLDECGNPHMASANWVFHDGTKPRPGSTDATICLDCRSRLPGFGSATLEVIDRFKIIPGYQRVVPMAPQNLKA